MMFPTKQYGPLKVGKYSRVPFDPHATYTVAKTLLLNGKLINAGDVFDKTLVNTRRLRQMYEQRMLQIVDDPQALPQADEVTIPTKPDFLSLSNEGLRLWLRNNGGFIPKPRTPRPKLLELVEQKWQEYMDALAPSK